MAHGHTATLQPEKLNIGPVAGRIGFPALIVGIIALIAATAIGFTSKDDLMWSHFLHSYLAAYAFFMVITLASIIFVLIQYLARAAWSVLVRRIAERMGLNIFLMLILILPLIGVLMKNPTILFEWMGQESQTHDAVIIAKSGYMNPTFFYIRLALYFLIWCSTAAFYAAKSKQQDATGDPRITVLLERLGAPLIILFGFSLTGFAFDWVVSLNPYWFSTMFGVYFFAGGMLSMYSCLVLLTLSLKKRGLIGPAFTHEHFHDLGKWMFAFTFFWGYTAFAQYMLIWYSNIPEETQFFLFRQIGPWAPFSLVLLFVHLVIPFPGLLSRHVKRKNAVIAFWAVWQICACAVDVYWLVVPSQWIKKVPDVVGEHGQPLAETVSKIVASTHDIYHINPAYQSFMRDISFPFEPLSVVVTVCCFVGIAGLFVFSTMMSLRGAALVPVKDPRLPESLAFENI
ncbi:MAG: hypothetical protein ACTHN5_18510 [Phycisphaerae bacterium]